MATQKEPISVPAMKTVKENPKEMETFLCHLQKKEFFDIVNQKLETLSEETEPRPCPSQPASVSDQGSMHTCSSHCLAKCVVDIMDGFGLDCDQNQVIQELIRRGQPDQEPEWICCFNKKPIFVEVWVKGQESNKRLLSLSLLVQPTDYRGHRVTSNWTGPKMTPEMMKSHHTRMIACWKERPNFLHAIYVNTWTKTRNSYDFDCINSHGEIDKFPQLKPNDISELYYISLYSVSTIQVTSTGEAGDVWKSPFGIYQEEGMHNGCLYYKQLHFWESKERWFCFSDGHGSWFLGWSLGGSVWFRKNQGKYWEFYGHDDNVWRSTPLKLTQGVPAFCNSVEINCSSSVEILPSNIQDFLGTYLATGQFSMGRQVFKHTAEEYLLLVHYGSGQIKTILCKK